MFAGLAVVVGSSPAPLAWDLALLRTIHRYANADLDRLVVSATNLGTNWGVLPAALVLTGLGLTQQRWRAAIYLSVTLLGNGLLNLAAKALWHRTRPDLWEVISPHLDFSFPSGHAMASMGFVSALVLVNWGLPGQRLRLGLGGLFVLFIGWSRLYLGVHFPSDIVAGWLLSLAWTVAMALLLLPRPQPLA